MASLRRSLVSIAALVVYLAAGIAGRGLHHHAAESRPAITQAACGGGYHLHAASSADDPSGPHPCTICTVLHQAQARPIIVRVVAVVACAGAAAVPIITPHRPSTRSVIQSRAPPAA